ncbi:extracellular solute-binding protein [Paenibacillus humicola]|uniref:extracellular solute-binding protein n=1 Tax=Paenibacillus humicola TaxID=3110540 RepID=UPI00237A8594|nr:extracellular solute-binding protein [Paenibacillus humicola]
MRKRVCGLWIVLLAVMMAVSACSGSKSGSSTQNGGEGGTAAEGSKDGGSDQLATLTVTTPRWPNTLSYEYGQNDLTTWEQDQTHVKIKWNLYPDADKIQKLNLELSSGGDLGDVIMGDFGADNSFLATYGSQDALIPLEDLIDKYAPNIKEQFEQYPDLKKSVTAPDGHIYGLRELGVCYNCDRAMRFWINSDFLKKLNMKMPTTTDELEQYLKAVKEKDPNGNGKADEIGITGSPKSWYANIHQFILHAFTYFDGDGLYVKNDKIVAAYATPEWRDGLRYLNKLYKEGLIDPAAFTNDENQMKQTVELNNGETVGAVAGGGQHVFAANDATRLRYQIVMPLKGPSGFQNAYRNDYGEIGSYKFMIPASVKDKEAAIKWIDFQYTADANARGRYGTPGVNWDKPKSGTVAANGGEAQFEIIGSDIWQDPQKAHWHGANSIWQRWGSDARSKLPAGQFDLETSLYDAAKGYDQYAEKVSVPKFFFDPDTAQQYNQLHQDLKKYYEAATADFIVGNRDIEKDWDTYLSELKNIGLDQFLKIQQTEYDKNWKGKS